ncbi:MAG TPA: hypothetical protein VH854_03175 [Thermoanaerobaculia bacterium]|nr:hypothetical protein [Thermoanaerobaculia bacterium]
MKLAGAGTKRQAILFGSLGVVLLLALVRWRPGGKAEAPAATQVASRGAAPATGAPSAAAADADSGGDSKSFIHGARRPASTKEISPDEVPELSMKDLAPSKGGAADTGRNLFGLTEPTKVPPPTPTPRPPMAGDFAFIGPLPPPPPTPTPHPPEVTFKFIGSFGPRENPIAVIQQGETVLNARAGDTLFGKFVLKKVGYESVDVGFVDFPHAEPKRLGITQ